MELIIGLIIGISIIFVILCGIFSIYYYYYIKKLNGMIWVFIGIVLLCLVGFFVWVVWFGL